MTTATITSTAASTARPPIPATARVWRVTKLQLTNRWNIIGLPWTILGVIFVMNIVIWLLITSASAESAPLEGTQFSGSTFFIFVYMLVVAIQAINLTFPFALGYGVTRRDYYLGTSLTWILLSAALTAGITILGYVEEWTGGWGIGGHFFTTMYFGTGELTTRLFTTFAMFLFFFFIGTASGSIYVRWRANGLLGAGLILAVLLLGLLALVGLTNSWAAVGDWIVATGVTGIVAWSLVATALAAVAGYFLLQRATPKS